MLQHLPSSQHSFLPQIRGSGILRGWIAQDSEIHILASLCEAWGLGLSRPLPWLRCCNVLNVTCPDKPPTAASCQRNCRVERIFSGTQQICSDCAAPRGASGSPGSNRRRCGSLGRQPYARPRGRLMDTYSLGCPGCYGSHAQFWLTDNVFGDCTWAEFSTCGLGAGSRWTLRLVHFGVMQLCPSGQS